MGTNNLSLLGFWFSGQFQTARTALPRAAQEKAEDQETLEHIDWNFEEVIERSHIDWGMVGSIGMRMVPRCITLW